VYQDGVQAIIDTVMQSPEPVTIIAVGPVQNIAEALRREPAIARRARLIGMHGSVRVGYGGSRKIAAEYNVLVDPKACRKAFTAPWDITITPLDTCGLVHLTGDKYKKVRSSKDPLVMALVENYRIWSRVLAEKRGNPAIEAQSATQSSTLFDTVAVYLAVSEELVTMEQLGIRVTDDGRTLIDPDAKVISVATGWKEMAAFEDFLVERICGPARKPDGQGAN